MPPKAIVNHVTRCNHYMNILSTPPPKMQSKRQAPLSMPKAATTIAAPTTTPSNMTTSLPSISFLVLIFLYGFISNFSIYIMFFSYNSGITFIDGFK